MAVGGGKLGLEDDDRSRGVQRVVPFTLRLDIDGHSLPVPMLDSELVARLIAGDPLGQALRSRRDTVFKELLRREPELTMDQVRRMPAPTELLAAGGRLPRLGKAPPAADDPHSCRMDLAQLRQSVAVPDTLLPVPEELAPAPKSVLGKVSSAIEKEGRSAEMARSFVSHMVALKQRFCPRFDELEPGQLVAIALDIGDRRMNLKTRYRSHVPVLLTLYTEAELAALEQIGARDRQRLDDLLTRRVARLLTEAYCQGGLLSLTLIGVLTHQSPSRVGALVNQFEATCGLVLPTPGTIHDAGNKLTHKAAIVRLHLQGMDCKRIARETFHSEEAVGRYVDDFERVLIARAHGLPVALLPRVLRLGPQVVTQYEELIAHHIGSIDDVRALLHRRGVDLEEQIA